MTYRVVLSSAARRPIERGLPEAVAVAVVDFLYGALAADPYRVGKRLRFDLDGYYSHAGAPTGSSTAPRRRGALPRRPRLAPR